MNMRKWLISAVTLTLALTTAGAVTAFALTGDGGSDDPQVPNGGDTAGEVLDGDPTDDGLILDFGDGIGDGKVLHGDPTYEEWLANSQSNQGPVTSIDDIDPNVCNLVHNINACTSEDFTEVVTGEIEPGFEVEGDPEPLVVDGESRHQSLEEAIVQDCGLAGGLVYVTSDGQGFCVVDNDLGESGEEQVSSSQPPTIEPLPVPATR